MSNEMLTPPPLVPSPSEASAYEAEATAAEAQAGAHDAAPEAQPGASTFAPEGQASASEAQPDANINEPGPRIKWPGARRAARAKQTGIYAGYLLLTLPVHVALIIPVAVLYGLGVGLLILGVGFPILIAGIMLTRLAATGQRKIHAAMTGIPVPERIYLDGRSKAGRGDGWLPERGLLRRDRDSRGSSLLRRALVSVGDPQSWRDMLWVVAALFVSILTWSVTVIWVATMVGGLLAPILEIVDVNTTTFSYVGFTEGGRLTGLPAHMIDVFAGLVIGFVALLTAPRVLKRLARIQLACGEILLSSPARDREDIDRLTDSRAAARQSEASALRRLERDLHDGPQQRLVRLNMDLARTKRQAGSGDVEKTQQLIDQAMKQTQDTLLELRQLSRGIAPPVLVDRGLEAAIMELSARSTVPVKVSAELPSIPMHVATAAYFVVTEALVNVNKHSQASLAEVSAEVREGTLHLKVTDNGIGGASTAKGHGLAGLVERLTPVDGTLEISSPAGGPTILEAVIPCES